jgi:hypothetical protein
MKNLQGFWRAMALGILQVTVTEVKRVFVCGVWLRVKNRLVEESGKALEYS